MADTLPRPNGPSVSTLYPTGSRAGSIARRERRREFQVSLSERLHRAQSLPVASSMLGLQIGPSRLLVDLAGAGEILALPTITPVPLVKPWYRGLINVRGNLLGVVDLSLFANGPATPLDQESRVLSLGAELRFASGILVSRMLGLRHSADLVRVADGQAVAPSPFEPWLRSRLVDKDGGLWDELDLRALTRDERFLRVERF
jgi:twitching motility protein PilI